jgi:RNA polymerase sigma-70 factor (ECF subfamily)
MSETSDEALVASVVTAKDAAAFEALVRRHQSKVRNWLRQLTRDSARADDLAQETFIRAWERAHTYGSGALAADVVAAAQMYRIPVLAVLLCALGWSALVRFVAR